MTVIYDISLTVKFIGDDGVLESFVEDHQVYGIDQIYAKEGLLILEMYIKKFIEQLVQDSKDEQYDS